MSRTHTCTHRFGGDDSHQPTTASLCTLWQSSSTAGCRLQTRGQSRSLPAAAALLHSATAAHVTAAFPTHTHTHKQMVMHNLFQHHQTSRRPAWPLSPLSLSDIQSAPHPTGTKGGDTHVVTAPSPAQAAPSLRTMFM